MAFCMELDGRITFFGTQKQEGVVEGFDLKSDGTDFENINW